MLPATFLSATNHLLAQAGWARGRLMAHAGRTARLDLEPLVRIDCAVSEDGHLASWAGEDAPDVILRLPLASMPRGLAEGPEGLMREVRVEGNAEFADALGFVFRHLRWDVEEDLSRLIGDIAAHRLVDAGRRFGVEGRDALERASGNLIEFLTEERPVLVARAALPGFATDIAALRDAVGRLDKRVARIERAAAGR
jgi:ubiquinone biosynthesis protein UbiJ